VTVGNNYTFNTSNLNFLIEKAYKNRHVEKKRTVVNNREATDVFHPEDNNPDVIRIFQNYFQEIYKGASIQVL